MSLNNCNYESRWKGEGVKCIVNNLNNNDNWNKKNKEVNNILNRDKKIHGNKNNNQFKENPIPNSILFGKNYPKTKSELDIDIKNFDFLPIKLLDNPNSLFISNFNTNDKIFKGYNNQKFKILYNQSKEEKKNLLEIKNKFKKQIIRFFKNDFTSQENIEKFNNNLINKKNIKQYIYSFDLWRICHYLNHIISENSFDNIDEFKNLLKILMHSTKKKCVDDIINPPEKIDSNYFQAEEILENYFYTKKQFREKDDSSIKHTFSI